jgi:hypothetical protein
MFELVLGVLLAAIFVTTYLLVVRLFARNKHELGNLPPRITLNPLDTARAIGAGPPPRVLKPAEQGRHNPRNVDSAPDDNPPRN